MARSLYVALVVVMVLALPAPARAGKGDKKEANRHFQLGVALYDEHKYEEALVEFQRAHDLAPHPLVLYNLAATYRELSRYDEAIVHFERFLAEAPAAKVKKKTVEQAQKELEELRNRVGTVTVTTTPAEGVTVIVDGREVGETPLPRPLVLGPGQHTFEVRGESGRLETRVVTLAAGDAQTITVDVTVVERPPTPPPPPDDRIGDVAPPVVVKKPLPRRYGGAVGVAAAMATNALAVGDTGAPTVGLALRLGGRLTLGVDVVTVAWAVVPSVRLRLAGRRFAPYLVAAAPVSITDGGETDAFVAGAGGLGVRFWAAPRVAFRAEAMVSFAGKAHGTTLPAALGVEAWF